MGLREDALAYHGEGRKGKLEVTPCKPCETSKELGLAYTPGVAAPCLEIEKDPSLAYEYTNKGNLVGVVSNGSAVLGLGNIGALAGKPVMEGKGVLFKRFADIDVYDINLDTKDPDEIIKAVKLLAPTFGGINLEDIKAPECFYVEEELKKQLDIPIFHDDQHGTAIICTAAFLNALEITGKKIEEVKCVFTGAGAAGIACAKLFVLMGVKKENLFMTDSKGIIYKGRTEGMNPYKEQFARDTELRTLAEAIKGADAFLGVSAKGILTQEMVKTMAKDPIIFAMANPDPEITPEEVAAVRDDAIMATGRSDYPNQVNNVLGFPFIFRGALDVRATQINEEMKAAAVRALADLAKEEVPDYVTRAYGGEKFKFGRNYIIPKPFDPRVLYWEAPAIAKAAMDSGVARKPIKDFDEYRARLEMMLDKSREFLQVIFDKAKANPKRIAFPEGDNEQILSACRELIVDGVCKPILITNDDEEVKAKLAHHGISENEVEIVCPLNDDDYPDYVSEYYNLRKRKGVTPTDAQKRMLDPHYFGSMMVRKGRADGLLGGLTHNYPTIVRPGLEIIDRKKGVSKVAGLYIVIVKGKLLFFADTTMNITPNAEELADIAIQVADYARNFNVEPKVAMLSFSNFGSSEHRYAEKMREAVQILRGKAPHILVDGEMQADTAVVPEIMEEHYPFSTLQGGANVLIFPDLDAGNIAYKLLQRLGGATVVGPVLVGFKQPVNILQKHAELKEILNMAALTVVEAQ
ncbi:MAG: NADP-dependent malic enzyme [Acidobacteria bacterium]|nr:MAG: NADP-dependent malic enzyme [Acidobacteriota bacterium]